MSTTAEAAGAGARLEGYRSELLELRPEVVLPYVYARLSAEGSLAGRLEHAAAVLVGTAESSRITTHDAPTALRSGADAVKAQLTHGPDGPASLLTLSVAEVAVGEWIVPSTGADRVKIAWVMTGSTAGANPGLFPVPKAGLIVVDEAKGPVADEVHRLYPDGLYWGGGPPALVADPAGEVVTTARWWAALRNSDVAKRQTEAAEALGKASGPLTQVAIGVLVEAGSSSAAVIERAVSSGRQPPGAELALRAALWHLGAKDDATQGLVLAKIDATAMNAFGLVLQPGEDGQPWAFQAPPPDAPLAPLALSGRGQP